MRARYYNPDIKRFINQDVIQGILDNAITLNRFAYANGNPISYLDPFGLYVANNGVPEDLYERLETEKYQRLKEEKAERQKEIRRLNRELEWNQFWGGVESSIWGGLAVGTDFTCSVVPVMNFSYRSAQGVGNITNPNMNWDIWLQQWSGAGISTATFFLMGPMLGVTGSTSVGAVGGTIKNVFTQSPYITMGQFYTGTLVNSATTVSQRAGKPGESISGVFSNKSVGAAQKYTPTNINMVKDKYLKKMGIDAHQLKTEMIGNKNIAQFDLYVDKDTGMLWLYRKKGVGEPIPTYEYIK